MTCDKSALVEVQLLVVRRGVCSTEKNSIIETKRTLSFVFPVLPDRLFLSRPCFTILNQKGRLVDRATTFWTLIFHFAIDVFSFVLSEREEETRFDFQFRGARRFDGFVASCVRTSVSHHLAGV